MRIIKIGNIKPKYIKCSGCGATLEYTKNDVNYSQISNVHSVVCPLCCTRLILDSGNLL